MIIRHPLYDEYAHRYDLWNCLYEGGTYVEGSHKYLTRHHLETDGQYSFRVQRSTYKNYVKPICGVWNSHVWRKLPSRTLGNLTTTDLSPLVNTEKGDLNSFFQHISLRSLVTGVHFVLVDAPKHEAETMEEVSTYRPKFISVKPEDVINWGFSEETGELEFVTIQETVCEENGPFTEAKYFNQYRVITKDKWEIHRESVENGIGLELVESRPNLLGEIPLVPFYFIEKEAMIGRSLIADIESLVLKLFQKENEFDICEFYSAVPFLFFKGFSEDEIAVFLFEPGNAVRTSNVDASIQFIESSGSSIAQLRETLKDLYTAIMEIALRQFRNEKQMPMSYIKGRLDKMQLETQLAAWSALLSESEKRCWYFVGKYLNKDFSGMKIVYNTDYSIEEVQANLLAELRTMVSERYMEKEDLVALLEKWDLKSQQ